MTDDAELLPSAYLDGELTDEERARVESDPELLAEVERLDEIRGLVADVEPASPSQREAHLAAALAARSDLIPSTAPQHTRDAPATSLTRTRWRSSTRWAVAAAAAAALIIGAGIAISTSDQDGDEDIASDAASVTEAPLGSAAQSRDVDVADAETADSLVEEAEEAAEAMTEDATADTEAPAETEAMAGEASATDTAGSTDEAELAASGEPDSSVVIAGVTAFDPDGDGAENDAAAAALAGADPADQWSTMCYPDPFMGDKRGVGLVVSFDQPSDPRLVLDVLSAPFRIRFYASASQEAPTTFEGWGEPVGDVVAGVDPVPVRSPAVGKPVRHVLVVFEELGPAPGCSASNPYRGTIGDVLVEG